MFQLILNEAVEVGTFDPNHRAGVTDPPVTLARKVGPGLQDLQKRG